MEGATADETAGSDYTQGQVAWGISVRIEASGNAGAASDSMVFFCRGYRIIRVTVVLKREDTESDPRRC
jgi:hypothetical protein